MALRPRSFVALAVVAVLALAGASTASSWPRLSEARRDVTRQWRALEPRLEQRYAQLGELVRAVRSARQLDLLGEVDDALSRWKRSPEVPAANGVEGAGARLVRTVRASASLSADPAISAAVNRYQASAPTDALDAYNRSVRQYDRARARVPGRFFADLLGFGARPTLDVPR